VPNGGCETLLPERRVRFLKADGVWVSAKGRPGKSWRAMVGKDILSVFVRRPEIKTTMSWNWRTAVLALGLTVSSSAFAQNKAPEMMPYTTVDRPEFVSASEASFLSDTDVVIGVSSGGATKAYPGADLAQHGAVQDQMPDGPIAITW
jgi:hypothetical protein